MRRSTNAQLIAWLVLLVVFAAGLRIWQSSTRGIGTITTGSGVAVAAGQARTLAVGDRIQPGEQLETTDQTLMLRFADDATLQLQPQSTVLVAQYQTGTRAASVLRLVRGALRTVSGRIAKQDPSHYRIETPVATIGLRGTEFSLDYCANPCTRRAPGLLAKVHSGAIVISNEAGEVELRDGDSARVASRSQLPRLDPEASITIVPPITP